VNILVADTDQLTPTTVQSGNAKHSRKDNLKILHFVTGGFSGATQVAIDLCLAAQRSGDMQVMLVLRRKRNTDSARVQALIDQGLDVRVVPGWSHLATIFALYQLARQYHPDILVAHGFSEHLWGRYAGLLAKVPHLVHVEHNSRERYNFWRLWQAKWLAKRTAAIVGVSEGVRDALVERGFPVKKCIAIPNGVELNRFKTADHMPWSHRSAGIIMASRFARQKDQGTLIQALQLLKHDALQPSLSLAGGGKTSLIKKIKRQVKVGQLENQVLFLGQVHDLPQKLMKHQIFVLSTHYEGMPLALVEAMAAGCACIATNVVGVRGVIDNGLNGLLVQENDPYAMAMALTSLLKNPDAAKKLGAKAREKALNLYSMEKMQNQYAELFHGLLKNT
jgi:glycosyltransferase involved in cell wall biosynthesis